MHNSSGQHPQRGHIFDCSWTKAHLTCRLVKEAQDAIEKGAQEGADEKTSQKAREAWEFLIQSLVVDRQHKAPLRVEDLTLDFVEVVLDYARLYCHGNMPKQVNFRWPYTKGEARLYEATLKEFDTLGVDGMPDGMLDGKTLEEIAAMRQRGEIPIQVYNPLDPKAKNPQPAQPQPQAQASPRLRPRLRLMPRLRPSPRPPVPPGTTASHRSSRL